MRACDDLNAWANGKWLAAHTIPADRSSWGSWDVLEERSLAVRQRLAEQAAADPQAQGVAKIVADFWLSGMDVAAIEARGLEPLRGRLDAIDALADGAAVADYLRRSTARGERLLVALTPQPDFRDPTRNIAYVGPNGLGLPGKNYYFDAGKQDILAAYQAHIAKVLELGGTPAPTAAAQAPELIAFETRLAKVSHTNEELARDITLRYHPLTPAEADRLTPNFPWSAFFAAQGITVPPLFIDDSGLSRGSEPHARRRAGRDLAYLAALADARRGRAIPRRGVRGGRLRVLRQGPRRPGRTQVAWQARARRDRGRRRRGVRPALRRGRVHARVEGPHAGTGRQSARRARRPAASARLDE